MIPLAAAAALLLAGCGKQSSSSAGGGKTLLNVSYDPTREFYVDFNKAFTKHWQAKHGHGRRRSSNRTAGPASRRAR